MLVLLRRKLKTAERVVEGQQPIRPFRRVEHVEARSIVKGDFTFADEESAQQVLQARSPRIAGRHEHERTENKYRLVCVIHT